MNMFLRTYFKKRFYFLSVVLISFVLITIQCLSSLSSYFKTRIVVLHSDSTYFKPQLSSERLHSYNLSYDDSRHVCGKNNTLNYDEKSAYHQMANLLQTFRKQIVPYPSNYFNGRGIVLTVGVNQLKFAKVNLKMMELIGTKLSVQIWYSSSQVPQQQMMDLLRIAPGLNVSACCFLNNICQTLKNVSQLNPDHVYKPRSSFLFKEFPYKPAAILSSTFSEVLFLDCDSYITRDPEELFLSDPMYLRFGALFFPDAFKSRQHPAVWDLFNTSCAENEYEFDSAAILVNKEKVWNGLYLAKLMNDHHALFYKYVTDGDKDTFRLAFRYMQVKYYLVMTPCSTGTYNSTHFCGYSLCKTDSLSQHIYINHIHLFKYNNIQYSPITLGYTRIGLGDPNNNSFYFHHCTLKNASTSCFHILKEGNEHITVDNCYTGTIPSEEVEDHPYALNESLISKQSTSNRVLISKTDNLTPNFLDNFLRIVKTEL